MLDPNSWRLTLVSCGVSPAAAPAQPPSRPPATPAPPAHGLWPRSCALSPACAPSFPPALHPPPHARLLKHRGPAPWPRTVAPHRGPAPWPCTVGPHLGPESWPRTVALHLDPAPWARTLAPHRGPAPWPCTLTLNLGPRAARRAALGVRCGDDRLRPCRHPGGPVARGVRGGRHVRGEVRAGVAESRQRGRRRDPLSFAPRVSIYLWIIHSLTDSSGRLYGRRVPLCVFRVFSVWRAVPGQRRRKTRLCLSLWARARSNIAANCTRTVTPEGSIERLAVL